MYDTLGRQTQTTGTQQAEPQKYRNAISEYRQQRQDRMQSIQSAAGLALLLGAASTAAFTLPPTRRAAPWTRISATNEDWRQACDSDGVVSYYDYGVRLGGADSDAVSDSEQK